MSLSWPASRPLLALVALLVAAAGAEGGDATLAFLDASPVRVDAVLHGLLDPSGRSSPEPTVVPLTVLGWASAGAEDDDDLADPLPARVRVRCPGGGGEGLVLELDREAGLFTTRPADAAANGASWAPSPLARRLVAGAVADAMPGGGDERDPRAFPAIVPRSAGACGGGARAGEAVDGGELHVVVRRTPTSGSAPPPRPSPEVERVLCDASRRLDVSGERVAMIDLSAGTEMVGAVIGPVASTIASPVMDQVAVAVASTLGDKTAKNVGRDAAAFAPEVVSAHVARALELNVTNILSDSVTSAVSERLITKMSEVYSVDVQRSLVEGLTPTVSERASELVAAQVPSQIDTSMPQQVARELVPALLTSVTQSVAHALTPAVLLGVSATMPGTWEFPKCKDTPCEQYQQEMVKYYVSKHSAYFTHYYSSYYASYYAQAAVAMGMLT